MSAKQHSPERDLFGEFIPESMGYDREWVEEMKAIIRSNLLPLRESRKVHTRCLEILPNGNRLTTLWFDDPAIFNSK